MGTFSECVSLLFFSWLDPLIWTGYRRELKQEDLYAVPNTCRSQILLRDFKTYVFDMLKLFVGGGLTSYDL